MDEQQAHVRTEATKYSLELLKAIPPEVPIQIRGAAHITACLLVLQKAGLNETEVLDAIRLSWPVTNALVQTLQRIAEKGEEFTQDDLKAVLKPLYDAHQEHTSLVVGCAFCEGLVT